MNSKKEKSTSASRMRKMREKLKSENPDIQHIENLRFKELKAKKKEKITEKEKADLKQYERNRKRLQRAKKSLNANKNTSEAISETPYKSPNTYGKAIRKTMKSLASSPRKRKAVVSGIAKRLKTRLYQQNEKQYRKN